MNAEELAKNQQLDFYEVRSSDSRMLSALRCKARKGVSQDMWLPCVSRPVLLCVYLRVALRVPGIDTCTCD